MPVPPESLEVGKCYLINTHQVWRIIRLMPDGRIQYEQRAADHIPKSWQPGMLTALTAEMLIEREVPCDWTPEMDEASR